MGTRAAVRFHETAERENDVIVTLFRQYDGYPSDMGRDLQEVCPTEIVNGFTPDDNREGTVANGMGCLAATVVSRLKEKIGNVYLYSPGRAEDAYVAYVYEIYPNVNPVGIGQGPKKVRAVTYMDVLRAGSDEVLYSSGPVEEFEPPDTS